MNALTSYVLVASCLLGQVPTETAESLGLGILLADSGKLYEGKIDHLGNLYRVQSGGRFEMVREANVVFSGQSREDAYEFLKSKKKADVAEDAAKLADWCKQYGLAKEAVAEAKLAVKMAPDNRAFAKLLADCEVFSKQNRPVIRVVGTPPSPQATVPAANANPIPAPPLTIPAMTPKSPAAIPSTKPEEIETYFAKHVQPAFMNLCANCHADPNQKMTYRLTRLPEGILVSPKTRDNVVASLGQIRKDQPSASPLVNYAITPHGGKVTPPISRATLAFKNLETWVTMAAATLPEAPAPAAPAKSIVVVGATTPLTPPAAVEEPKALPTLSSVPPMPVPTQTPTIPSSAQPVPAATPAAKPVDPFDPVEFNQPSGGGKK